MLKEFIFNMRVNRLAYFLELVKKEFIEIGYSRKNLLLVVIFIFFIFYMINTSNGIINNIDNACYLITVLVSCFMPMNFLTESILSDKRNQAFERYFVMGKIRIVMYAKFFVVLVIDLISFIVFYTIFLLNGVNIINNIYTVINTPLYFWIGSSISVIIMFLFVDEKSISFAGVPCMLLMVGLIKVNYYIETNYDPIFTCIIAIGLTVIMTIVGYKFYKSTKYFLKV